MNTRVALTGLALLFLLGCGGGSAIGESCDTAGSTDECASGAICSNASSGPSTCRKLCTEQAECAATENCNGVSNSSSKSCQPK